MPNQGNDRKGDGPYVFWRAIVKFLQARSVLLLSLFGGVFVIFSKKSGSPAEKYILMILLIIASVLIKTLMVLSKSGSFREYIFKSIPVVITISIALTVSSLFWTTETVYNRKDLQHVELGWPIRFAIQNHERFDPPFPWDKGFAFEVPGRWIWHNFFASIVITFLFFYGVLFVIRTKSMRTHRELFSRSFLVRHKIGKQ